MNYEPIPDARWVAEYRGDVYVLSGSPAIVSIWDRNTMSPEGSFEHAGIYEEGSKSTLDVDNRMVFVAGGERGLLIYDLEGNLLYDYVFEEDFVTNAVTVDNGMAFISNGNGGVYIATYDEEVQVISKLDLGDFESVNHIALHDGRLYVASGLGGVKVIEVSGQEEGPA